MASTGGVEVIKQASDIIGSVCRAGGCIYAHPREGFLQEEAPWDCTVLYEDHVVENFAAEGCQSAAVVNPEQQPHEFSTLIPGTMTETGFTKHDGKAPMSWEAHRREVSGFHFSP